MTTAVVLDYHVPNADRTTCTRCHRSIRLVTDSAAVDFHGTVWVDRRGDLFCTDTVR